MLDGAWCTPDCAKEWLDTRRAGGPWVWPPKPGPPPALIHPPAGLGRCLQGRIAVKSQGVTQQRDISRRSISSTMNQSHKQPTKQPPPPKSFPCQGWGSPWAGSPQREQGMGRLWGARGASSPQLFGGTWGGGTGKSPPRMR